MSSSPRGGTTGADDFCSNCSTPTTPTHPDNGTGISYHEVESVVYGISFAGHDPVTALLCNTLRCLLPPRAVGRPRRRPGAGGQRRRGDPALRVQPGRLAAHRPRDTSIGGVEVPAGTRIFLNFAAANHQPEVFADPDVFDIHRDRANRHISFGKGGFTSASAPGWRGWRRIVLEVIAERLTLRLVEDQRLRFFPNITFRGPTSCTSSGTCDRRPGATPRRRVGGMALLAARRRDDPEHLVDVDPR